MIDIIQNFADNMMELKRNEAINHQPPKNTTRFVPFCAIVNGWMKYTMASLIPVHRSPMAMLDLRITKGNSFRRPKRSWKNPISRSSAPWGLTHSCARWRGGAVGMDGIYLWFPWFFKWGFLWFLWFFKWPLALRTLKQSETSLEVSWGFRLV